MPQYAWLLIILGVILAWWLWSKYGALYMAVKNNPQLVHAAQAVDRYATDITGLVGAFETSNSDKGSFTSRLGSFFGTLPT